MRVLTTIIVALMCLITAVARDNSCVTVNVKDASAELVFKDMMRQAGLNFAYSDGTFAGERVTISVRSMPLQSALKQLFAGTQIKYKLKGRNVVLKRKSVVKKYVAEPPVVYSTTADEANELQEVVVVGSRLDVPDVESAEIGTHRISPDKLHSTPMSFGENDVIKTLQLMPGVVSATDGLADMNVHGGESDENLYMLDNVPIYQVSHFCGLFSAFNVDAISNVDFFKSSFPAKYDGRLSSFMDARTAEGNSSGHHGSFKLGLTSGSLFINGPISHNTNYLVALRRSWFDIVTLPFMALLNAASDDEKVRLQYAFTDLNAKVTHNFSHRSKAFVNFYFGDDMLNVNVKDDFNDWNYESTNESNNLHWGNILASTGWIYRFNRNLSGEFTGAYTRYFSKLSTDYKYAESASVDSAAVNSYQYKVKSANSIDDIIIRGDLDWRPMSSMHARFGASYTFHTFLPEKFTRKYNSTQTIFEAHNRFDRTNANEVKAYVEDDWHVCRKLRANVGVHATLFNVDGDTKYSVAPRASVSFHPVENFAVKAAYSRTNQFVHRISESYLSLPTDNWLVVSNVLKPQTADQYSLGINWQSPQRRYLVSVDGYYKSLRNIVDYRDEYYMLPAYEPIHSGLVVGRGTAKGIDVMIEKNVGKISGHVAYSLLWADRTFPEKNNGVKFPARFDNRHNFNVLLNWRINEKWQVNAAWTAHSGNRFTLMTQVWDAPAYSYSYGYEVGLKAPINNYRLPFYHRLDLGATCHNAKGYWTFSLYNAYCNMNTVAIRREYSKGEPVFQKVSIIPIIPSISYTWTF